MRIHTINEAVEPISNILHENGASGVVIEDPLDLIKERDTFFGEIYELNPAEYPEEGIFIKAYLAMNASFDQTDEVIKQSINSCRLTGLLSGGMTLSLAILKKPTGPMHGKSIISLLKYQIRLQ